MVFKLKVDIKFYWLLLKLLSLPKLLKHSLTVAGMPIYMDIWFEHHGNMVIWLHGLQSKKWSGLGDWETGDCYNY